MKSNVETSKRTRVFYPLIQLPHSRLRMLNATVTLYNIKAVLSNYFMMGIANSISLEGP